MRAVIENKPSKEFTGLIEKFWMMPRQGGSGQRSHEILPDGNFDLVFILTDSCCKLLFAGPHTKMSLVPTFDKYEYFFVRFRPGQMPRLADVAPAELIDNLVEIPRVLDADVNSLGERLTAAQGLVAKQKIIEKLLKKTGLELTLPDSLCSRSAALVELLGGRITVSALAQRVGVHVRKLERIFQNETGISPKKFIRLIRFQNAISKLRAAQSYDNLADLASHCGYADQSHFIKDFKAFSQRLPSAI